MVLHMHLSEGHIGLHIKVMIAQLVHNGKSLNQNLLENLNRITP